MNFFDMAIRRDIQRRSLKTAVVVGTLLGTINYGDLIVASSMEPIHWLKLGLTYLVPYSVATWASVMALLNDKNLTDPRV